MQRENAGQMRKSATDMMKPFLFQQIGTSGDQPAELGIIVRGVLMRMLHHWYAFHLLQEEEGKEANCERGNQRHLWRLLRRSSLRSTTLTPMPWWR